MFVLMYTYFVVATYLGTLWFFLCAWRLAKRSSDKLMGRSKNTLDKHYKHLPANPGCSKHYETNKPQRRDGQANNKYSHVSVSGSKCVWNQNTTSNRQLMFVCSCALPNHLTMKKGILITPKSKLESSFLNTQPVFGCHRSCQVPDWPEKSFGRTVKQSSFPSRKCSVALN